MKECKDCVYGDINYWGHMECWKFDQELDMIHTANREKQAMTNSNHDCEYYEFSFVKFIIPSSS